MIVPICSTARFGNWLNFNDDGDALEYLVSNKFTSLGNGIINADGDMWRIQRKAGLRFFSQANLKSFIDQVLPRYMPNLEKRLDGMVWTEDQREHEDLQDAFLELTTALMGKMAYDVCDNHEYSFSVIQIRDLIQTHVIKKIYAECPRLV